MKYEYVKNKKLPDSPGVYTFRDYKKRPVYIGRATSLKDRVKSYFSNDLIATRGMRLVDMIAKSKSLTWQKTESVLEAVLLEGVLIRKYQPYYNVDDRDDKSSQYVVITDEEWPRVFLERARDFDQGKKSGNLPYKVKDFFGPFPDSAIIKEALKILRRLFPFRDKKAADMRHEEFYKNIGRSPIRDSTEDKKAYDKTIRYLRLFFRGESKKVRELIQKEMKHNVKMLNFEEANKNKKLLYALDHISNISLIKKSALGAEGNHNFRIEAFDIAHLSGTDVVGSMAVIIGKQSVNSEYRKFKITKEANNDTGALAEMIGRRLNHPEWTFPDLIVVDGNKVQMDVAESILKARRISIPVVAVTKDEKHKADKILGISELIEAYKDEIIKANSEAHRFAITYHRMRRNVRMYA